MHHVSQGQRTRVSSCQCPDNEQINKHSAARQFKLLIVLPEIKVLLEGGQRFFSKNATAQGQVLILKRTWILYQIKISFKGTSDFHYYIASLKTVHRPLTDGRGFQAFSVVKLEKY